MKKQMTKILLAMGLTLAAGSVFAAGVALPKTIICKASGGAITGCTGIPQGFTFGVTKYDPASMAGTYYYDTQSMKNPIIGVDSKTSTTGHLMVTYVKHDASGTFNFLMANSININQTKAQYPDWNNFQNNSYTCEIKGTWNNPGRTACSIVLG